MYGGFIVQAAVLYVALAVCVNRRWPRLAPALDGPREELRGTLSHVGTAAAAVVAGCQLVWAVLGPGHGGPSGFVTVAQRSALAVVGGVIALGAVATQVLGRGRQRRTWSWSVAAWLGSSTAFAGGLTGVLLEPRITGRSPSSASSRPSSGWPSASPPCSPSRPPPSPSCKEERRP
ncbi:hypothetical protein ACQPX6_16750 [Actinomycetospora sp. CA-101289]|uniref:hypothetical protein n=1 Tax=Actinomycetospora sp. CA-101289 TaxID=3239893 RepID=UPI003D973701